jgi:hypothetical protein
MERPPPSMAAGAAGVNTAMGETMYEFKENVDEAVQAMDDIDDFERRLAGDGGGMPQRTAAVAAPPRIPGAKPVPPGKKPGSDYVKSAQRAPARTEVEDDAEEARLAVSDLDKFEQQHGGY